MIPCHGVPNSPWAPGAPTRPGRSGCRSRPAAGLVERLPGVVEQVGRLPAEIVGGGGVALGDGDMGAGFEQGGLPRRPLPEMKRLLGDLEVMLGPVDVADIGTGDDGWNR